MADISKINPNGNIYDIKDTTARAGLNLKADKVLNATANNFATLDANGNLTDSGKKTSDFMASDGVEANPTGTATGDLTSIGIGGTKYNIPSGGGGTDENAYHTGDTAETTLADDDYFPFYDTSASAKRKTLWSNIKATLKSYFDSLYATVSSVSGKADISAIAPEEAGSTSSRAYAVGEHFYKNGKFCTCTQAIAQGATFTLGTNYVEGTVANPINFRPVSIVGDRLVNVSGGYRIDGDRVDITFCGDLNFDITSTIIMPNYYTFFGAIGSDLVTGLPKPKAERVYIQVLASSGWTTYILHGIVYTSSSGVVTLGITSPLKLLKSSNYKIYVSGIYYR